MDHKSYHTVGLSLILAHCLETTPVYDCSAWDLRIDSTMCCVTKTTATTASGLGCTVHTVTALHTSVMAMIVQVTGAYRYMESQAKLLDSRLAIFHHSLHGTALSMEYPDF